MALFVRFWLTTTPPLPDTALAAAQASGRERYRGFVESLGRRMETGASLARELYRSEEHTSELQSLMRISYAVFCLKKKTNKENKHKNLSTRDPNVTTSSTNITIITTHN